MFQFYGRSDTSFVCAVGINQKSFKLLSEQGDGYTIAPMFPARHLDEGEFVLGFECDASGRLTGRELTLFVAALLGEELMKVHVVMGDPDVFWNKQSLVKEGGEYDL